MYTRAIFIHIFKKREGHRRKKSEGIFYEMGKEILNSKMAKLYRRLQEKAFFFYFNKTRPPFIGTKKFGENGKRLMSQNRE